jgi:peroxiredoxin
MIISMRWTLALAAAVALAGCTIQQPTATRVVEPAPGAVAAGFTAPGSDGAEHTLASLTEDGPVFLYFIQMTCPVNNDAVPYFKRLSEAYEGRLVGVFDGDERSFVRWQREHDVPFLVLFDPDMKIIREYDAKRSPWVVEVARDGSVANVWPGYSAPDLDKISGRMAAGGEVAAVSFAGAPADTQYG